MIQPHMYCMHGNLTKKKYKQQVSPTTTVPYRCTAATKEQQEVAQLQQLPTEVLRKALLQGGERRFDTETRHDPEPLFDLRHPLSRASQRR